MKLFLAAFLCGTFTDVKALGCEPELWPCSLVGDIAIVTCAGGDVACVSDPAEFAVDPEVKTIDADSCRDLCITQAATVAEAGNGDPACAFYRWENNDAGLCSLQTICGDVDVTCDEPSKCASGEIGCSITGGTECNLDAATTWNHETFHWICHGKTDVNIYAENQIKGIPDGTFCQTTHKCSTWNTIDDTPTLPYWRKLGIFCNDGVWKPLDDSGKDEDKTGSADESRTSIVMTDPTDDNSGVYIAEPSCASECEILQLTHIEGDGTEIFCDHPLKNGNILEKGNSCILICDNHWTMSISCEFASDGEGLDGLIHDGEKQWQDQNGALVEDDNVKC